jgi:hypothetical protein
MMRRLTVEAFASLILHRLNADLTFDSICELFFLTVATAADKDSLQIEKSTHTCPQAASPKVIPLDWKRFARSKGSAT